MILNRNFVQLVLLANLSNNATTVDVASAISPFQDLPDPASVSNGVSYLVLSNDINAPSFFEIISYTGRTAIPGGFRLTGVTRGIGETTPRAWNIGDWCFMTPIKESVQSLIFSEESDGKIVLPSNRNMGLGVTPTEQLDVERNARVRGNLRVDGLIDLNDISAEQIDTVNLEAEDANILSLGIMNSVERIDALEELSGSLTIEGETVSGAGSVYNLQEYYGYQLGRLVFLTFDIDVSDVDNSLAGNILIRNLPVPVGRVLSSSIYGVEGLNIYGNWPDNGATDDAASMLHVKLEDNFGDLIIVRYLSTNSGTSDFTLREVMDNTKISGDSFRIKGEMVYLSQASGV